MARPKKYSYENFSQELTSLCEKYQRLDPNEMIKAMGRRADTLSENAIPIMVDAAFKSRLSKQTGDDFFEKIESIKQIAPKKIDKCPIVVIQKKKPGRPRKYDS